MAKVITIPQGAIIYEIDIELFRPMERPTIYTKQYDSNTRYIVANVYNDGEKYTLTTSDTIRFACTKPDGFGIYNECGIDSKGKIVYQITDQTTAKDGQFPAEFRIYNTYDEELGNTVQQLKTTANLKMWVEKSALNNSTITSSDEANVLTDLIVEATKAINGANSATQEVQQVIADAQIAVSKTVKAIADTEKATQDVITTTNTANSTIVVINQKIAELETVTQNSISTTNTANDTIIVMNQKIDESEAATQNSITATNDAKTTINTMNQKISKSEQATQKAIDATDNANTAIDTINEKIIVSDNATQDAITVTQDVIKATQNSITATNTAETATNQINQLYIDISNTEANRQAQETIRQTSETTRQSQETTRQEYYDAYKVIEKHDNNKQYIVGNKVTYSGGTYQNILDSIGIPPTYKTDNDNWVCIAKNGEDGAGGDMYKATYDSAGRNVDIFYYADNAVSVVDNKINKKASAIMQTATGTSNVITLNDVQFIDGFSVNFIVSYNNSSLATTINGKPLYKPNTTTAPNLSAGKAVTAWYNSTKDCFFIKASANGTAVAEHVLAGKTFSNDSDTGIVGTMPEIGGKIITPTISNIQINNGYHNGVGYVKGDINLKSDNIIKDKSIFGVQGSPLVVNTGDATAYEDEVLNGKTYYKNGVKYTGGMPNFGDDNISAWNVTDYPESSYAIVALNNAVSQDNNKVFAVDGYTRVRIPYARLSSAFGVKSDDIRAGVNMFGVQGSNTVIDTAELEMPAQPQHILKGWVSFCNGARRVGTLEAKRYATGTTISSSIGGKFKIIGGADYNCGYVRISSLNLGFVPSIVIFLNSSRQVTWTKIGYTLSNYIDYNDDGTMKNLIHTTSPNDYIAIDAYDMSLTWYAWE